jgi:hypothetical protein
VVRSDVLVRRTERDRRFELQRCDMGIVQGSVRVRTSQGRTNEASKASAWVSKNLFAGLSHPKDIL